VPIGKGVQRCKKRRGGLEAGKTAHALQPREDAPKGMGTTQEPHEGERSKEGRDRGIPARIRKMLFTESSLIENWLIKGLVTKAKLIWHAEL